MVSSVKTQRVHFNLGADSPNCLKNEPGKAMRCALGLLEVVLVHLSKVCPETEMHPTQLSSSKGESRLSVDWSLLPLPVNRGGARVRLPNCAGVIRVLQIY
jgi:hypothetical protein